MPQPCDLRQRQPQADTADRAIIHMRTLDHHAIGAHLIVAGRNQFLPLNLIVVAGGYNGIMGSVFIVPGNQHAFVAHAAVTADDALIFIPVRGTTRAPSRFA